MGILNSYIVKFVKILPKFVVFVFARKYIAGTKLEDAVRVVKELNSKGIMATLDVLGEAIKTKQEAVDAKKEILTVLDTIEKNKLNANVSLKPTQLGLGLDEDFCFGQIKEIVQKAAEYNNFIRIDMEDSPFTSKTINLFRRLRQDHSNLGIVVQAYLKRTYQDVEKLNVEGTNYRLCKGIYVEPAEIAYKERQQVRDNFMQILDRMITHGNYVGIATHDDYLVDGSYKLLAEKKTDRTRYEFQMLYGVKDSLRNKINEDGHRLRIYVPYGEKWYHYSIRRLQENPQVAWYITKSLFSFR
ncbi:MAG: proline dehydrogenase family protein [Ignavibacteriales bacterium]|nr:proline dehydrogenase family protein [Ignavibacteriales bacterium]MCF8304856.1 proline dehydrogenase family protein [Ignavibacteriales bacterium]MCF8314545.1 proline dehydrogenase family protein [Ignavibacteriales bacterium]MCF8436418.1 proline dehydrogenase family protein [Ignavibacteriales bacterium]